MSAMGKTRGKIDELVEKINGGQITAYDLKIVQEQLLAGEEQIKVDYTPKHAWHEPFFSGAARDDIKGREARDFYTELGLSLLAFAALAAAPFTGGASADA